MVFQITSIPRAKFYFIRLYRLFSTQLALLILHYKKKKSSGIKIDQPTMPSNLAALKFSVATRNPKVSRVVTFRTWSISRLFFSLRRQRITINYRINVNTTLWWSRKAVASYINFRQHPSRFKVFSSSLSVYWFWGVKQYYFPIRRLICNKNTINCTLNVW